MRKTKSRERIITGTVIPAEWDDDDNVTAVAIETEDGERYQVERSEKADELLTLSGCEIEATGFVKERADGTMIIALRRYEWLGDYEDEYSEELGYEDEYTEGGYVEREDDDDRW